MTMPTPTRRDLLVAVALPVLLLLTWLASRAALSGPFIFDDYPNLANLTRLGGTFDLPHLADYLQAFIADPGRPLAALSFLIDDYAWPSNPAGFKRTNLLLHLLGGVLVFGFVRSIAAATLSRERAAFAALLAAAAWLLHPMQLSTSMLVVQRMTQLMTLVCLAALWWASGYIQRKPLNMQRSLALLAGLGAATLIAFLCKENGALLPLYALVMLFVLLRPRYEAGTRSAHRVLAVGLALPVLAILAQIAWITAQYVPNGMRDFTPGERVLTQPRVLLEYLGRIALPRLDGSGLFHDDYTPSYGLLDPPTTLLAVLVCLALLCASVALWKRMPLLAFAVFWYFGGHLIESSPLSLELYFEHRNYLPMVGPFAAAAIALARMQPGKMRRIYLGAALAWLALCAGMTAVQSRVWSSEAMLAGIWAQENPRSARAVELQAKVLTDINRDDAAYEMLVAAMENEPSLRRLALDLVLIDCKRNTLTREGIAAAARDIRHSPFNRSSLEAIMMLQQKMQQGSCRPALDPAGWTELVGALLAHPAYRDNPEVAAFLWVEVAKSRIYQKMLPAADEALQAAYDAKPDPELARVTYLLLYERGYCDLAEPWNQRVRAPTGISFDAWMQRLAYANRDLPPISACKTANRAETAS